MRRSILVYANPFCSWCVSKQRQQSAGCQEYLPLLSLRLMCVSFHTGYCEFKYDDDKKFPSGQTVEFRCEQVASRFGKTTATLNLDITVTWDQQ